MSELFWSGLILKINFFVFKISKNRRNTPNAKRAGNFQIVSQSCCPVCIKKASETFPAIQKPISIPTP